MKIKKNNVYKIDNLRLMKSLPDECIDLIYCDVLYGTGKNFGDYQDLKPIRSEIEKHYMLRIKEMKRVLKNTGSIYLQMDWRISHWMRIVLDDVFGYENFRNEICWQYGLGNNNKKRNWQDKHDIIFFVTKTKNYKWNEMRGEVTQQMKQKYGHKDEHDYYMMGRGKKYYLKGGKRISNVWDISNMASTSKERVDYKTQKPMALVERIIKASSDEGDLVADFYLGSGTTAVVCKKLNRKYLGCDISEKAIQIAKKRLSECC